MINRKLFLKCIRNGGKKMAVSKACVPYLTYEVAKIFKEDIDTADFNISKISEGKLLLKKLLQQRKKETQND